jgi:hypothetical protein
MLVLGVRGMVGALGIPASLDTLGVSRDVSLLLLFVALPVVVGIAVVVLVDRKGARPAPGMRTSELLAHGDAGRAEVLELRSLGTPLDVRPMVSFRLSVRTLENGDTFELTVVQAIPRRLIRDLGKGATVDVRVAADRSNAAIVLDSAGTS